MYGFISSNKWYTMDNSTLEHDGLWDLFTLKDDYGNVSFDKIYRKNEIRNVIEPVVSRYMEKPGKRIEYPGRKKFAICLTHDIDDIYPPLSHKLMSTAYNLKSLKFSGLKDMLPFGSENKPGSTYRNFKEIMDIEETFDARSSFYFLATDRDISRYRYDVESLEEDIGMIADRGWEVGLHGGYYAFDSYAEIEREKKRLEKVLGKPVIGYRNHYLRFKVPDTWHYLLKAGFRYDTTIGYSNAAGFRNGVCHPFRPYDLGRKEWLGILEIPLAIMDCGIFEYARSPAEAFEISKSIIDHVEKYGGVATLLWHNTAFNSAFRGNWERLYRKLLTYCTEKGAWLTSGAEVCNWWERNGPENIWEQHSPEMAIPGPVR